LLDGSVIVGNVLFVFILVMVTRGLLHERASSWKIYSEIGNGMYAVSDAADADAIQITIAERISIFVFILFLSYINKRGKNHSARSGVFSDSFE